LTLILAVKQTSVPLQVFAFNFGFKLSFGLKPKLITKF